MKSTKIFAKIITVLVTFSLTTTAAFAAPINQILNEIATATSEDYIPIDTPVGDTDATRRQLVPYIYETRPDIFLSAADFYNVYYTHKSDDSTITSIHPTEDFISVWNDETYASNFWSYIDSIIVLAGISDTDTDMIKATKLASFIENNYRYDSDSSYAAKKNGISFFQSLTQNGITFCLMDARIFMACCIRVGIPCKYLESDTHAWNKVYINGTWMEVDITFDRECRGTYRFFDSGRTVLMEIG